MINGFLSEIDGFMFELDGETIALNLGKLMDQKIYESLTASEKALVMYLVSLATYEQSKVYAALDEEQGCGE